MVKKHLIRPERVRKIPKRFSWVDHRLVREGHIESLSHSAAALYLFLVTVWDGQGLSFYSDASVGKRLGMDDDCLRSARDNLIRIGLIAYEYPLYQVLGFDLPRRSDPRPAHRSLPHRSRSRWRHRRLRRSPPSSRPSAVRPFVLRGSFRRTTPRTSQPAAVRVR